MTLVFFLEEKSMEAYLEGLLPRLLPDDTRYVLIKHEGKQDLRRSVPRKLKAWGDPDAKFVVLHDQDQADCDALKAELAALCESAGQGDALVRIVCCNLESWILGDLPALAAAYSAPKVNKRADKAKYRDPDARTNGLALIQELVPEYQKVSGARAVAPHVDPNRNCSRSFGVFISGLRRLVEAA